MGKTLGRREDKASIYSKRDKRFKPVMQKRNCLRCDAEFESEGPHNRMCYPCKVYRVGTIIWPKGKRTGKPLSI